MWKRVKNKLNKIGAGTIKKKHHSKRPIPLKTTQAHIATGVLYTAWHYIHDTGSSVFFFAQHFGATALFIRLLACPAKLVLRQATRKNANNGQTVTRTEPHANVFILKTHGLTCFKTMTYAKLKLKHKRQFKML